MPAKLGHRTAHVHESQPTDWADRVVYYGVAEIRWRAERRPNRVPDELGTVPADTFPSRHIRAGHIGREGVPRTTVRGRDYQRVLRTGKPDGQVRPSARQVHGVLHAVPRRRGAQGRERRDRHHQDQADHRVRRLVPNWVQSGYQLPAAYRGTGR